MSMCFLFQVSIHRISKQQGLVVQVMVMALILPLQGRVCLPPDMMEPIPTSTVLLLQHLSFRDVRPFSEPIFLHTMPFKWQNNCAPLRMQLMPFQETQALLKNWARVAPICLQLSRLPPKR